MLQKIKSMEQSIIKSLKDFHLCNDIEILVPEKSQKQRSCVSIKSNSKIINGFIGSAYEIYLASSLSSNGNSKEMIVHWLMYLSSELFHCLSITDLEANQKYINEELLNRPYLCGFTQSFADVALFYTLRPFIENWTYYQKELHINISRWYNNMRSTNECLKKESKAKFSRTLLYSNSV